MFEHEQSRSDFLLLAELAKTVPVRRIKRSDKLSDLDTTCEAILADFETMVLSPE